jgi:hypothetical protein
MKAPTPRTPEKQPASEASVIPNGWLWNLGALGKMTEQELANWSDEGICNFCQTGPIHADNCVGDRVQWFRAEAEMQRWQEQTEQKLAELLRTSESFRKMQEIWTDLSKHHVGGYVAYAKQKAAIYGRMACSCDDGLARAGYSGLRTTLASGLSLVDFVAAERSKEALILEVDFADSDSTAR